ncbi:MAG: hypothetical protein JWN99_1396 [Ilumatobacteraceae bacterium]|nr:hypothetical protein [Ilumatobacteraceae bacterium]
MRYRLVKDETRPNTYRGELAPIPLRWLPDLAGRWHLWRHRRWNLRHLAEQQAACAQIIDWLITILAGLATVLSWTHDPRDDQLIVNIFWDGHKREMGFSPLRAWHHVQPRDSLAADVLEQLNAPDDGQAWVMLGSHAEECAWGPPS